MATNGEFSEYRRLILQELERLNKWCEGIDAKLAKSLIDQREMKTELKMKSGLWGVLGGMATIGLALLVRMF